MIDRMMINPISFDEIKLYFISSSHQYIFILSLLDGTQRCTMLGITQEHYYDREYADQWYNDILNIINLDKSILGYEEALQKLNYIYYNMIEQ
jgi:hypothetical protein